MVLRAGVQEGGGPAALGSEAPGWVIQVAADQWPGSQPSCPHVGPQTPAILKGARLQKSVPCPAHYPTYICTVPPRKTSVCFTCFKDVSQVTFQAPICGCVWGSFQFSRWISCDAREPSASFRAISSMQ